MRARICLIVVSALLATRAVAKEPPYYGPVKSWGIGGFGKEGYKERSEPDGSWRIDTIARTRDATEMALYRAAELAHDQGFAYVEMLGGHAGTAPGRSTATLYARPTRTSAAPATCWRKTRPGGCYTADVAEVMRRLSGPDGHQPGVPRPGQTDASGRQVSYGGVDFGFGVGAVRPTSASSPARSARSPVLASTALPPSPLPGSARLAPRPVDPAAERFAKALKEIGPVTGREKGLGWTMSD